MKESAFRVFIQPNARPLAVGSVEAHWVILYRGAPLPDGRYYFEAQKRGSGCGVTSRSEARKLIQHWKSRGHIEVSTEVDSESWGFTILKRSRKGTIIGLMSPLPDAQPVVHCNEWVDLNQIVRLSDEQFASTGIFPIKF